MLSTSKTICHICFLKYVLTVFLYKICSIILLTLLSSIHRIFDFETIPGILTFMKGHTLKEGWIELRGCYFNRKGINCPKKGPKALVLYHNLSWCHTTKGKLRLILGVVTWTIQEWEARIGGQKPVFSLC